MGKLLILVLAVYLVYLIKKNSQIRRMRVHTILDIYALVICFFDDTVCAG